MKNLSLLLFVFILAGCAKRSKKEYLSKASTDSKDKSPSAKRETEKVTIASDTPLGIGGLIILDKGEKEFGFCTFFAVGANKIATNSHCLENIDREKSCKETVAGIIQTTNGAKKITCSQVLFLSQESSDLNIVSQDYALFEINETLSGEDVLKVSREGFLNDSLYEIHTMNIRKTSSGFHFDYFKEDCTAFGGSFNFFPMASSSSLNISFKPFENNIENCVIIPGNSGSPITASGNSSVLGVVYATTFNVEPSRKEFLEQDPETIFPEEIIHRALGSNFSCSDLTTADLGFPETVTCEDRRKKDWNYYWKVFLTTYWKKLYLQVAKDFSFLRDKRFKYSLSFSTSTKTQNGDKLKQVSLTPRCFKKDHLKIGTEEVEKYSAVYEFGYVIDSLWRKNLRVKKETLETTLFETTLFKKATRPNAYTIEFSDGTKKTLSLCPEGSPVFKIDSN